MIIEQNKADTFAICVSLLCTVHCLTMPILLVSLPFLSGLFFTEETFHIWMVFAVLPISLYALYIGKKTHGKNMPFIIGGLGLLVLISAVLIGHNLLGETGEKSLTVLGSIAVASAHIWNYRIQQNLSI
ncbi:MAG: MerC domain-containing protein [Sedimenticola sp.]